MSFLNKIIQGKGSEEENDFDPFQVFGVEHRQCLVCYVKVVRGRKISKGRFWDFLDWPDPYVLLKLKTSPEGRRWTKCITNCSNPIWEEEFTFCIDCNKTNIMNIILMEGNYGRDTLIASTNLDLGELPISTLVKKTFDFGKNGQVDCEFILEFDCHPDLRFSLCLCDQEKNYRSQRLKRVFESLQGLLDEGAPNCLEEVPVIAVMGSGGGFRAMTGFSGAMKALEESKILDCTTYTASLSGSSWFLSTLYSHPEWPMENMDVVQQELRSSISQSVFRLLRPTSLYHYMDRVMEKRRLGQPVSFTDFFGLMVGETLLTKRMNAKLSDQRSKLVGARTPMPLYACVHVKKDVSARVFQEWVEFTPYELGMPKYGCFLNTENFGNKYYNGRIVRRFNEPPLHYLQGVWGSAFCILFKQLIKKDDGERRHMDPVEIERQEFEARTTSHRKPRRSLDDIMRDCSSLSSDERRSSGENRMLSEQFKQSMSSTEDSTDSSDSETEERELEDVSDKKKSINRKCKLRGTQKGFWENVIEQLFQGDNILNDRRGRAAIVHNFMRGLSMHKSYPIAPFTPRAFNETFGFDSDSGEMAVNGIVDEKDEFDGLWDLGPQMHQKHMYMVDAGLTFNSPYPLLLRQQRGIDLILSFDFSARRSDNYPPFKEILLAYKWALMHKVPFPKITLQQFYKDGMKEVYVFKDPNDPRVPTIMHFVLVNKSFREFKHPNVPRETDEEIEFGNFAIFDDPQTPYSTFNFTYDPLDFDRLSKLAEYNVLNNIDLIKACIKERIESRRHNVLTVPITSPEIEGLNPDGRKFNRESMKRLKTFLFRKESEHRLNVSRNDPLGTTHQEIDEETVSLSTLRSEPTPPGFDECDSALSDMSSDLASLPDSPSDEMMKSASATTIFRGRKETAV